MQEHFPAFLKKALISKETQMKRPRNMAEMRRSYEGTCIIRKRTSKPQAKRPRGTTPSMKVHALATPNMESSAHEAMSDPSKARCPPKKAGSQRRQNEGGLRDNTSNGKGHPATTPTSWLCRPPSQIGNPACNHHPKPKSRLAALCHKPAFLHIKQIGTH